MSRFARRLTFAVQHLGSSPPPTDTPLLDMSFSNTITSLGDPDPSGTIVENSGFVLSRKNTSGPIIWCHNDSGNGPHIFAISANGGLLADYMLEGTTNNDWEDIAIGPGPDPSKYYIYVGNIGSQAGTNRCFYRLEEPSVAEGQTKVTATIPSGQIERFPFSLPVNDSEGFFVDPISGDAYLFQKNGGSASRPLTGKTYRFAASQFTAGGATVTPSYICDVRTLQDSTNNGGITCADISLDGKYFVAANYEEIWGWKRDVAAGETISQVLQNNPVAPFHAYYTSGWGTEAVCFNRDRSRLYAMTEGGQAAVKYVALTYS